MNEERFISSEDAEGIVLICPGCDQRIDHIPADWIEKRRGDSVLCPGCGQSHEIPPVPELACT